MFLLNSCLGLPSAARRPRGGRPFSLSYGAILPSSLAVLLPPASGSSPHPPVSVSGTGGAWAIAAFLGARTAPFATEGSLRMPAGRMRRAICLPAAPGPAPGISLPRPAPRARVPASSAMRRCRNVDLPPLGYAPRPPLRPRLPQGRSASPWNPWIFGLGNSHPHLATHSGILPPRGSTGPPGPASPPRGRSPTGRTLSAAPRLRRRA